MIKVYSKDGCSKCVMLKRWLDVKKIEYTEVNISEDEESRQKLIEAKKRSLPVLEINGEFVTYNEYNDILDMIN